MTNRMDLFLNPSFLAKTKTRIFGVRNAKFNDEKKRLLTPQIKEVD